MKCFYKGEIPLNNGFLKNLEQYERELNLDSDNIVFVTKNSGGNISKEI